MKPLLEMAHSLRRALELLEGKTPSIKDVVGWVAQIREDSGFRVPDRTNTIKDWWYLCGVNGRPASSILVSTKAPDSKEGVYDNPAESGSISYPTAEQASKIFATIPLKYASTEYLGLAEAGVIVGPKSLKAIEVLATSELKDLTRNVDAFEDALMADAKAGDLFSDKFTYKRYTGVRSWSLD